MCMKRYLLVVLAACVCIINGFAAVPYLLNESFEEGIPDNWTQEVLSSEQALWAVDTEDTYPAGAFDGTKRIALRNATGENKGYVTRLITPVMNLATTPDPQLVFAFAQPARAGFHDTLAIYFRLKSTSDWILLRKYTDVQNRWKEEVINLVATYGQATAFQLAFEANEWMGRGIVLDNIRIFPKSQCDSVVISGVVPASHSAEIIWTGDLDATYEVLLDTVPVADPTAYDKTKTIYYNNNIDGYDGGVTVTGIPSSPNYFVYVRATCSDNESGYTNWATYRFATSAAFPFVPSFADSIPAMWDLKDGAVGSPLAALEDSGKDGWQHTSSNIIVGDAHVYSQTISSSSAAWLITPLIDMEDAIADQIDLKFRLGISGSASSVTTPSSYSLGDALLYILVSQDEGATWIRQDSLFAVDLSTTAQRFTIDMTAYKGTNIRIAFVVSASSSYIYFHLGKISLVDMNPACAGISNLNILPTLDGAELSWSLRGTNKNAVIHVSSNNEYTDTLQLINVSETSATISALTSNTSYYVTVRQDCNLDELLLGSFHTECDRFTVDDGTVWTEGFENMELGSSTSDAPDCWALLNANQGAYPYIFVNNKSDYVHTGSKSLYFESSNSIYGYAIMPAFNDINDLQISFSYKDENAYYSGYLELGYMTNPTDAESFVSLVKYDRSTSWVTTDPVSLEQIPASDAARARVAFKYGGASTNYYLGIDDITLSHLPFCRQIGKVSVSEITENGAVINFGATAHSQSYHLVLSTTSIDPDTYETSDSVVLSQNYPTNRIALEDASILQPNTHYYVYVRSFCGDDTYGEWAEEIDFHTKCTAFDVNNFGVEDFREGGNFDCWTTDYRTKRTSDEKCSNTRVHDDIYGDYLLLSHEAVDTITHDGAYAITPQLAFEDGDNITNYQVTFSAATTSQAATNLHKMRVAIVFSTSDLSIQYTVKTIDLAYAADSNAVQDYTVTFANYPGYMGYYGAYVMFAAVEAAEHDSTNYILIDNVTFERASSCPQVIKSSVGSVGLHNAELSWEDTGAPEYEVMVSPTKTRQPEELTDAVYTTKVTTNKATLTSLAQTSQYYAYIRGICGVGDSAKWSNAIAFRTANGVPYAEYFDSYKSSTYPVDEWRGYRGDSLVKDIVDVQKMSVNTTSSFGWYFASKPNQVSNMDSIVVRMNIYSKSYTSMLVSPSITFEQPADGMGYLLSFRAAAVPFSTSYSLPITDATDHFFKVMVSTDDGKTFIKHASWEVGKGDYDYNSIKENAIVGKVDVSEFAGKTIKLGFIGGSENSNTPDTYFYIDSVAVREYSTACGGASRLSATVDENMFAEITWHITGNPQVSILEMDDTPEFENPIVSITTSSTSFTYKDLASSTTYYVRVKQDCQDAEWVTASFTTPYGVPFVQSFDVSEIPSDWSLLEGSPSSVFGGSKPVNSTQSASYIWKVNTNAVGSLPANHVSQYMYKGYYYGSAYFYGDNQWLTSPVISLSDVFAGDSLEFGFDVAYSSSATTLTAPSSSTNNHSLLLLVSDDGGATWKKANSWEWTQSDNTANVIFPISSISGQVASVKIDFSQFAGRNIRFAFVSTFEDGSAYFHLGNVYLKKIIPNCDAPSAMSATGGDHSIALTWTADAAKPTIVEIALNEEFTRGVRRDTVSAGLDTVIGGLQSGTIYYTRIRQICKGGETEYSPIDTALTECSAITDEVWYENFDAMTTGSKTSAEPAMCWDLLKANGIGISASTANYIYVTTTAAYVHTPNKALYFQNDGASNAYVILPEIADLSTKRITFYHSYSSVRSSGKFVVGYITDIADESTFVAIDTVRHGALDKTPSRAALSLESFPVGVNARLAIAYCGGTKTAYAGIDDITIEPLPTCLAVEDLGISGITGTSAVASFSAHTNADHYEVLVATQALDVNWKLTVADSAKIVFYERNLALPQCNITNLLGSTGYYVYARVACGESEFGDWSDAAIFHTDCDAIVSYPWIEDFESYVADSVINDVCWRDIHSKGTGSQIAKTSSATAGDNTSMKLSVTSLSSENKVMVATPYFSILEADKYEFSIDVFRNIKSTAHKGLLHIYLSASDTIDAAAVKLATVPRSWSFAPVSENSDTVKAESASGWYTYTFAIPQIGDRRIILEYENSTSGIIVDNLGVREIPNCADVSGLKAVEVKGKTAIVTLDSVAWQYNFIATTAEIDPDTLANVAEGIVILNVLQPEDTVTITGLQPISTYYVYARTLCEEGYGYWSNPIIISTGCGAAISALPWTENFNSLTSGIPQCWDNSKGTTTTESYKWNVYPSGHSGACLRFNSYSNSSNNTNILVTPAIELVKYVTFSFYWKNPTGGECKVQISKDGGATKTTLLSEMTNVSDWTQYELDLSQFYGETVNIYFSATSNYGYGDAYLYLDDISINILPTCRVVTDIHANVSDTSAIISFNHTNEGAAFQVITANSAIVPSRIDGAGLDMSKIISIDTVTSPLDTVYGLDAQTKYYVYVRVLCDDTDKSEWASSDFTTACGAVDVPYTINFENELSNYAPSCWTVLKDGGSYPYVYSGSSLSHGGNKSFAWGASSTSSTQYRSWVSLPAINNSLSGLEMSFWIRSVTESYTTSEQAHDSLIVGVMTDPTDKTTFVRVQGFQPKSAYEQVFVDFSSYTGEGRYIAFLRQPLGTPSASGAYSYGYYEDYYYDLPPIIDDVDVHLIPACPTLRTLEAIGVTASEATISLGSNTTVNHEVIVSIERINPDTVALVPASSIVLHEISTTASYALTGLVPSTTYYVYARNNCDATTLGDWKDISFTTAYAASVPFIEDFAAGAQPDNWNRYSGLASSVFAGGKLTASTSGWVFNNTNVFGTYHTKLNVYGTSCHYWLVTPNILLPESDENTGVALEFDVALSVYNYSTAPSVSGITDDKFIVAISLDGGETWLQKDATIWASDGSGQYSYTALNEVPEHITIDLTAYAGKSIMIGFYGESTVSGGDNDLHIANVSVNPSNLHCLAVSDMNISKITTQGAAVDFRYNGGNDDAVIVITKGNSPDYASAIVVDTIYNDSTYSITGLQASTTYNVFIARLCDEQYGISGWTKKRFSTALGVRFEPVFAQSGALNDWGLYSGLYQGKNTALTESSSAWSITSSYNVIGEADAKANIWGTSSYKWLVTPVIDLSSNVGDGLLLHFEAALTKYNSREASTGDCSDDRMLVLVSTDNCQTWTVLAEWNNTGTGDYAYDDLTNSGTAFHINMTEYAGMSNVRIAFYGESTVSGADNDLHIGNIILDRCVAENYTARVCYGDDYDGSIDTPANSFYVEFEDYEVGVNLRSEYRPAIDESDVDSMLVLMLTVDTAARYSYPLVICEGEHYSDDNFNFTAVYGMRNPSRIISTAACDSVVELNLTVNPKLTEHVYDSVLSGDAYLWHGTEIYLQGNYPFDTISTVTGCDSVVVLHLTTYVETALDENSVYNLKLTPNPVEKGQPAYILNSFSPAELSELRLEVYSTSGALVYSASSLSEPLVVPGLVTSGLHLVRIITSSGTYISPLVVK